MIMVKNPFGISEFDTGSETAAKRIGKRIKNIRTIKGFSQAELGERSNLTADRIQKYENGARSPKAELLKNIADALEVSVLALEDPTPSSYINSMFVLFELAEKFGMSIEKISDTERGVRFGITTNSRDTLFQYLREWYDVYTQTQFELELATTEDEKKRILKSYDEWKWSFPEGIADKTSKELQKLRLKNKIEELQKAYNELDDK